MFIAAIFLSFHNISFVFVYTETQWKHAPMATHMMQGLSCIVPVPLMIDRFLLYETQRLITHYCVHNSLPLGRILRQLYPVHILMPYYPKKFNIIFSSMPSSCNRSHFLRFSKWNFTCGYHHMCYIPCSPVTISTAATPVPPSGFDVFQGFTLYD
jgi:hypothetical protein